jgi:hypothetical protein
MELDFLIAPLLDIALLIQDGVGCKLVTIAVKVI